jgi:hypothetical protein
MKIRISAMLLAAVLLPPAAPALDGNGNSQSDVWEMVFGAAGLAPAADADHDGWTNSQESVAGTNPFAGASFPRLEIRTAGGPPRLRWQGLAGKRYTIESSPNLAGWTALESGIAGNGAVLEWPLAPPGGREFFKLQASDADADGDGVSDWEELTLGFDPTRIQTGRFDQTDSQRIVAGLSAANTITASTYDDTCSEGWPDPAVLVLRRSGGLQPLTVNFSLGGSATPSADYLPSIAGGSASFAAGQREVVLEIAPVADAATSEPAETVTLTILTGSGYSAGAANSATVTVLDPSGPSAKEAARFLALQQNLWVNFGSGRFPSVW